MVSGRRSVGDQVAGQFPFYVYTPQIKVQGISKNKEVSEDTGVGALVVVAKSRFALV